MRFVLLAAVFWLCAGAPSSASCVEGEVCASEEGIDVASLMQKARPVVRHLSMVEKLEASLPDLGSQWSKATDWVKNLSGKVEDKAGEAQEAINNGMTAAVTALGNVLNRTLAVLSAQAEGLQSRVLEAKGGVTSGVASLLKRTTNASIIKVPTGEKYEAVLDSTLQATTTAWSALEASANSTISAITQGLTTAGMEAAATSFNATMQEVLINGQAFVDSLQGFRNALQIDSSSTALLQGAPTYDSVLSEANQKLQQASDYTKAFPKAFMGAFSGLEDRVVAALKGTLSEAQLAQVTTAFDGVRGQAKAAAEALTNASNTLIKDLQEGLAAAKPPPLQAAATGLAVCGPALLLLLSVALFQGLAE